ncbi:MAG: SH3 domain-containing protein [Caldilineaceae bacterium]|nr:SH3 domain-containing protein [Caldilineaceae bacterium]
MPKVITWIGVAILVMLVAIAAPGILRTVQAAPLHQDGDVTGTVLVSALNVRAEPNVTSRIVGRLVYGERVTVLDREPGWLQIEYARAPGGKAWASANYIRIDGEGAPNGPRATATPSAAVPPASVIEYRGPATFRWRWNGTAPRGMDWYFDILVFQKTASNPYKAIPAEPGDVTLANGTYEYTGERFQVKCDSYWMIRISQRENGRWTGFLSDPSNRQDISQACSTGGGSSRPSGGSPPPAEPTPCLSDCDG